MCLAGILFLIGVAAVVVNGWDWFKERRVKTPPSIPAPVTPPRTQKGRSVRHVHLRNLRLYNNAGMNFPECYAGAKLLDTDKGRLPTSPILEKVTCPRCLRRSLKQWYVTDKDETWIRQQLAAWESAHRRNRGSAPGQSGPGNPS